MLTTNFSPLEFGHGEDLLLRGEGRLGAHAVLRARAIRMKGLNAEPGWRWPLVARLNGLSSKSVPPTIALTSPVLFSIATSDGARADAAEASV